MRTTIRLDENILKKAKQTAVERNISLTKLIEEALQEKLYRRPVTSTARRVRLPTFNGRGLQPGVDLDDTKALVDLMSE
jgi:predicted DNA-binding ribbon-helix-helix protein